MSTTQDAFHSFHSELPASPKRRSSPDHGFVFVGDEHDNPDASQQKVPAYQTGGLSLEHQLSNACWRC